MAAEAIKGTRLRGPVVVTVILGMALLATACSDDGSAQGVLALTGDRGDTSDPTHDPTLFASDGAHYVFSTGHLRDTENPGGIYARRSQEGLEGPWESLGEVEVPAWTEEYRPAHLWAPHVVQEGELSHLYYAASSFGRNTSAIGRMTSQTPGDLDSWQDEGPVLTSGSGDPYNAIDPHVMDVDGTWWLVFGSHWEGIFLQELADPGTPEGEPVHLASRPGVEHNPIEAPTVVERDGWFYLFTSWDRCCAGVNSTYRIAVGRSEELAGPYVDREGTPMLDGGGTILLDSDGDQIGPGGQDVHEEGGRHYLVHHFYDGAANGTIRMQIRSIDWEDGWPVVATGESAES